MIPPDVSSSPVGVDLLGQEVYEEETVLCMFKSSLFPSPAVIKRFSDNSVVLCSIPTTNLPKVTREKIGKMRFIKPPYPLAEDKSYEVGDGLVVYQVANSQMSLATVTRIEKTQTYNIPFVHTPYGMFSLAHTQKIILPDNLKRLPTEWTSQMLLFSNGEPSLNWRELTV